MYRVTRKGTGASLNPSTAVADSLQVGKEGGHGPPRPEADEGNRWRSRPVLAASLRLAILLFPVVCAAAVTVVASRVLPHGAGATRVLFVALGFAAALATALVTDRLARRLLPIATLLKLTLLFPDRAPSRFKIARKANAVAQLNESVESGHAGDTATAVLALLTDLTAHDRKTRGHAERVRVYAELLADQLRLSAHEKDLLRWGALLHDIGKLEVAADILNKPGKPTDREWSILRNHPLAGAQLAASLLPWLGEWGQAIGEHHERYDGTGYPNGISGSDISRSGRLVAVVDAYEVMTAARSYKKPMTTAKAREELADCAGSHFDPMMVRAFLTISLPRLLWAAGPLSFLVQLPFIGVLRDAGTRVATTAGTQAAGMAGAAVLATTGTVIAGALPTGPTPALLSPAATSARPPTFVNDPGQAGPAPAPASTPGPTTEVGGNPSSPMGLVTPISSTVENSPEPGAQAEPEVLQPEPTSERAPVVETPSGEASTSPSSTPPPPVTTPTPTTTPTTRPTPTQTPTPPGSVDVTTAPNARTADRTATLTFSVPGATSTECAIDGGAWTTCSSPLRLSGLADGSHSVALRGVNADGTGAASTVSWVVDTAGPALSIDNGPSAWSRSSTATISFSTGDPDVTATCSLDSGTPVACVGAWTGTVADGPHALEVVASDALGNWTSRTVTWTVDTQPPTLDVTGGTRSGTSADLEFVTDDDATVTCELDGVASPCSRTNWAVSGLPDGTHTVVVTATDTAGNSTTASQTWTVDTTPPAVSLSGGPSGLVGVNSASIGISADADATVTCALDGIASPCTDSGWTGTGLSDGNHTLVVTATDPAGNAATATRTWTVKTTTPAVSITSAPPSATTSRNATVAWSVNDPGPLGGLIATSTCSLNGGPETPCSSPWTASNLADGTYTLTVTVSDPLGRSGTASTTWTVDNVAPTLTMLSSPDGTTTDNALAGARWSTSSDTASVSCTIDGVSTRCSGSRWNPSTPLSNGPHTLVVTATDAAGNVSPPTTLNWTVEDLTAPVLSVISGPSGVTNSRSATVNFTVDDDWATLTCSLDGGAATPCTKPWRATGLSVGSHSVVITATDPAGNSASISRSWTVVSDTTAPVISDISGPGSSTSTSAAVTWTVDDPTADVTCTLNGVSTACSPTSWSATGLTPANYQLAITATDPYGNASTSYFSWVVQSPAPATPTTISFTAAPSANETSGSPRFRWNTTSGVSYSCNLDGGGYSSCNGDVTVSATPGSRTFAVQGRDPNGTLVESASYSWTQE